MSITKLVKWQTIVLFGPSGAGKTSLAATAPRPFWLDSNKGLLSVHGRFPDGHLDGMDIGGYDDLEGAFSRLSGTARKRNVDKARDTIVCDHFDDIQDIVMMELGTRRAEKRSTDPDEAEQRDYGVMGGRMRRLLRRMKKLPKHKIIICGEAESKQDGRMTPSLVGALQRQLPYFADHTFYLTIGKKGKRVLHLDASDTFYAKTRAWWLPKKKYLLDFDDTTFLTRLFAEIAAGPAKNATEPAGTTED
jgi:hypothetical protein